MKKYRNKKTGSVVELNSTLKGGNWEEVAEPVTEEVAEPVTEAKAATKKKTVTTSKG